MYYIKIYVAMFVGFMVIDLIWLGIVARGFYKNQLGFLLSEQPNWWAAMVFYLLFIAGMLVFAVIPGLQSGYLIRTLHTFVPAWLWYHLEYTSSKHAPPLHSRY